MMLVLPPDVDARRAIARHALSARPHADIDWNWLADKTADFSGADVRHLCDTATEFALEQSMRKGSIQPVNNDCLKRALKEVRPSMRPWLESAKNYALFANDGGEYDDLLEYLKSRKLA
jgi:SpoVK/Ycf46/Vps4 family AAA+-type ATPase